MFAQGLGTVLRNQLACWLFHNLPPHHLARHSMAVVHFLCLPKENEPKEKALFPRYFWQRPKPSPFAKFVSKASKILNANGSYTAEKEFSYRPKPSHLFLFIHRNGMKVDSPTHLNSNDGLGEFFNVIW